MARQNWLSAFKGLFSQLPKSHRRCSRSPIAAIESLEERLLLTANLWVDFGDGLPAGGLLVSNAEAESMSAPLKAKDANTPILIESLNTVIQNDLIDFDGNGSVNAIDGAKMKQEIVSILQRIYEPFDVRVRTAAATSVQDVIDTLASNDSTSSDFDAYVFIVTASDSDTGELVSVRKGLKGVANGETATGANTRDDTVWIYADFFGRLATLTDDQAAVALANVAAHEAGHTFGLPHADSGTAGTSLENQDIEDLNLSNLMGTGGQSELRLTEPALFTRYDLPQSGKLTTVHNSYDLLSGPASVGLKANAPEYITGTGAHDVITITNNGDGTAHVVVEAFRDAAHTDSITSRNSITNPYEYDVSLAKGLLIELGFGNDVVELDASLGKTVTIRGGADDDTITLMTTADQNLTVDAANGVILDGATEIANFAEVEFTSMVEAAGLYVVDEGATVELTATVDLDDTDPLTTRQPVFPVGWFRYEWDLDNDGVFGETGTNAANGNEVGQTVTYVARVDGGPPATAYEVAVRVIDGNGAVNGDTTEVLVRNVNPIMTSLVLTPVVDEGGPVRLTGAFIDPSVDDVHTLRVDWGDGEVEDIVLAVGDRSFAVTHRYGDNGEYTVSAAIADDDTRIVTVQPIQVFDDNGENGAPIGFFEAETDKIWAQAGIDIQFLALGSLNETDFLDIANSTEFNLLRTTPGNGQHVDPNVINMWFVNDLALGSGIGTVDGNGIAIDQDVLNNNNIQAVAHELGHNLGLGHTTFGAGGPENLMTTNAAGKIQPDTIDDIFPNGDLLSQLTAEQIAEALASPFVRTIPLAENSVTVTVRNVNPEFTSLSVTPEVDENGIVLLTGSFVDPGSDDVHTLRVDWGDGNSEDITLLVGDRWFRATHRYLDDGEYSVSAAIADDDTRVVTIQPIQVFDDNGDNGAPIGFFEAETDKIWAQAGIDIQFLDTNALHETDYLVIENPISTEFEMLRTTPGNGQHPDPNVINMWFVDDLVGVAGFGFQDKNGVGIDRSVIANNDIYIVAHELGHNLGLGHNDLGAGGPENLMTTSREGGIKPKTIDDIYPDGDLLLQLTAEQIAEALASPFVRTMPLAERAFTVTVNNVAPEITSLAVNKPLVNEGETLTLGAAFTDPGTLDSHEAVISWGDGTSDTVTLSGERIFAKGHVYSSPGKYQIQVEVSDDDGATSPVSTIDVEVNALPVAVNDTVQTVEDVPVNIDVLANDTDPDGDSLSIVQFTAMNGSVVLEDDGTLTYTPNLNYNGPDILRYRISDGRGGFSEGTVAIRVLSPRQQLENLRADVESLEEAGDLNHGQANALLGKLEPKGSLKATINSLKGFISQVREFIASGVLDQEDGIRLISVARDLGTSLIKR